MDTIFQTLTDPRYYPRQDSREEADELSFDYTAHPTEQRVQRLRLARPVPLANELPMGIDREALLPHLPKVDRGGRVEHGTRRPLRAPATLDGHLGRGPAIGSCTEAGGSAVESVPGGCVT